ncbi:unnamed protein product, partial [Allacma fusca]
MEGIPYLHPENPWRKNRYCPGLSTVREENESPQIVLTSAEINRERKIKTALQ